MRTHHVLIWLAHVCAESHRQPRALKPLPIDIVTKVDTHSVITTFDVKNSSSHLSQILIPRVSDTEGNTRVQKYIKDQFHKINWDVKEDEFHAQTPFGKKKFTNLIMTHNPKAAFKLVLAAHFDSKFFPDSSPEAGFLGATDSAVPCAMLIDIAEYLTPYFKLHANQHDSLDDLEDKADVSLQMVFFDGEEAFQDWSAVDSIYGAKHLAHLWDSTYLSHDHALSKRRIVSNPTELDSVELMILLDLLGARAPAVSNFYHETTWVHQALQSAEQRLNDGGHYHDLEQWDIELDSHQIPDWTPELSWFKTPQHLMRVEDDHLPFLNLGVPILHIVPTPFPSVWHTINDDASAVHVETCAKWTMILRLFLREYFGLLEEFPNPAIRQELVSTETQLGLTVRLD